MGEHLQVASFQGVILTFVVPCRCLVLFGQWPSRIPGGFSIVIELATCKIHYPLEQAFLINTRIINKVRLL